MSSDKIDLTCPYCQSLLRVEAIHAGKKLRCPSCNHITLIPFHQPAEYQAPVDSTAESNAPPDTLQNHGYQDPGQDRYHSPPPQPSEYAAPLSDQPEHYAQPYTVARDGGDTASLTLGVIGIVLNFFCACLLPGIVAMNVIGFIKGYQSRGPLRNAGMVTNGISLAISCLWLLLTAVRIAF